MTNQAVGLKLSVCLDFQSYFFELATGIHCFNILCKILLLSKLINISIHSQNGCKNSQNNANQCSLMSHWTSIRYAVTTLLLGNCRYQTSVPVNSFQRGSCRPSEGSPRPSAFFFLVIFNLTLTSPLSGQETFFVGSLTQDPSLIWNTANR